MNQISESVIEFCQNSGMTFKKQGGELYSTCPFHQDGKRPNFRVNIEKNSWFCDVCGEGGGVVEFIAKKEGRDKKEVFKELIAKQSQTPPQQQQSKIVATYDYTDRFGNLIYQVCRFEPKTFRQRRPDGKGGWLWNLEGVERVLYRLPEIQRPQNKWVWILEGEKDVETIRSIGMAATCNVGGAGKWAEAYSQCLKGKDVILCGDNDDAGKKHMAKVLEGLEAHANSVRKIDLPADFKDVSDFASTHASKDTLRDALVDLIDRAQVMLKGAALPIKSMAELEVEYISEVENSKNKAVDLSRWLPSLRCVRPLVRGELVSIIGDTGTCKTYVLQNIALACQVPTLLFELELPDSLTFERFVGMGHRKSGREVFQSYESNERLDHSFASHVYTCTKSGLNPVDIESIISKSELRIGQRPTLVLVDYIQLVSGLGKSRYERVSSIAEQMKVIAKATSTVIILASQISRDKERKKPDINLHDAKDSGSIENSSGVVLGMWRDGSDSQLLKLRVLKNTKGTRSEPITCSINYGMVIKETMLENV